MKCFFWSSAFERMPFKKGPYEKSILYFFNSRTRNRKSLTTFIIFIRNALRLYVILTEVLCRIWKKNFFWIFVAYVTPGILLDSLKKCQPIRSSRLATIGNIYTNVLFYYIHCINLTEFIVSNVHGIGLQRNRD